MRNILGQDRAIEILRTAHASGRVHHAWIFSGPRGVGKFTAAVAYAKLLLDPAPVRDLTGALEPDPDGETSRLVEAGSHPDLHVIRKELALYSENAQLRTRKLMNIPLDVLREYIIGGKTADDRYHQAPAYLAPSLGHGKVFIIDEAELIDANGQHALLKTLEEPSPRTFIFLVTARPQRLLPTILSRCQHVHFTPLEEPAMAEWLTRADLDLSDDDRAWIARFSEGSPGLATIAVEYGFTAWQRTLDPLVAELEEGRFPLALGDTLAGLVEGFATEWVKRNKNASKDAANKDGARYVLALLAAGIRERLHTACATDDDPEPLLAAIDLFRDAEGHLAANLNLKQVLENLAVQWTHAGAGVG